MQTSPPGQDSARASLGELVGELGQHGFQLLRDEFELAKAESRETVADVGEALAWISVGAALLTGALLLLLAAAVIALGNVLPYWASALIVGLGVSALAAVVLLIGRNKLRVNDLKPDKALTAVQHDAELVMGEATH